MSPTAQLIYDTAALMRKQHAEPSYAYMTREVFAALREEFGVDRYNRLVVDGIHCRLSPLVEAGKVIMTVDPLDIHL